MRPQESSEYGVFPYYEHGESLTMRLIQTAALVLLFVAALTAAKTLDMYVVDVEGGKALLLVSPSGQSMLLDAGNPGSNGRDANRIVEACKAAGVKTIDFMVVTHYDGDHVANVPTLMGLISAVTFVDHGENVQQNAVKTYAAYMELVAKAKHIVVKPGDKIPIKGFEAFVITSAGKTITTPLKGAGQPNAACGTTPRKTWGADGRGIVDNHDTNENGMSIGLLITYGKFRMVDTADLTWNHELDLMCPVNRVGTVDLYMISNHGNINANSPAMVHALRPRVAILDNSARKFFEVDTFNTVKSSPGLEDYWQLHYYTAGGEKANTAPDFIANVQDSPDGKWIKISVQQNGTFTVTNTRNNFTKTYKPRK
jgi:beta-lactamase superfamily II metal-dependent hydrolase